MKMAEVENRMGKLSHQVRDVYFLKRNRKTVGHSEFSTMRFLKEEFFLVDNSLLIRKKQSVYRTRGYTAMNNMLIQTRHE